MSTSITRADLEQLKGISPKLLRAFADLFVDTAGISSQLQGQVAATGAIQNATVITLSSNTAFNNERILTLDPTLFVVADGGPGAELSVTLVNVVALNGGYQCTFNLQADTNLDLPSSGRVPSSGDGPYADDTAAAAAGIALGGWYAKTGGTVVWRQI